MFLGRDTRTRLRRWRRRGLRYSSISWHIPMELGMFVAVQAVFDVHPSTYIYPFSAVSKRSEHYIASCDPRFGNGTCIVTNESTFDRHIRTCVLLSMETKSVAFFLTHRPGILALKPAPIVASYLGYPGTVGAEHTDYTIADRVRDRTIHVYKQTQCFRRH